MDSDRFDTLTRSLHGVRSRRGALAALAALVGGTVGLGTLADTAAKKQKKGKRKKKEKPYTHANGARCKTRKECASALCGSGKCRVCALEADCGNAGCFCAQPSGGGSMVCVSKQYTSGAISNCALCKTGEVCQDANPGTFDCFPRCGA